MVWFNCEQCGDTIKKPKLDNHARQCGSWSFTCVDCLVTFDHAGAQGHTVCVTEHEKYALGATKPGGFAASGYNKPNGAPAKQGDTTPSGLEFLSTRPPWKCSICNVGCTSRETLLSHASGVKHQRRARAALAAANGSAATTPVNGTATQPATSGAADDAANGAAPPAVALANGGKDAGAGAANGAASSAVALDANGGKDAGAGADGKPSKKKKKSSAADVEGDDNTAVEVAHVSKKQKKERVVEVKEDEPSVAEAGAKKGSKLQKVADEQPEAAEPSGKKQSKKNKVAEEQPEAAEPSAKTKANKKKAAEEQPEAAEPSAKTKSNKKKAAEEQPEAAEPSAKTKSDKKRKAAEERPEAAEPSAKTKSNKKKKAADEQPEAAEQTNKKTSRKTQDHDDGGDTEHTKPAKTPKGAEAEGAANPALPGAAKLAQAFVGIPRSLMVSQGKLVAAPSHPAAEGGKQKGEDAGADGAKKARANGQTDSAQQAKKVNGHLVGTEGALAANGQTDSIKGLDGELLQAAVAAAKKKLLAKGRLTPKKLRVLVEKKAPGAAQDILDKVKKQLLKGGAKLDSDNLVAA